MAMHILVVEDEFLIRLVLSEALEEAGFDVCEAADGDAAASLIENDGFNLVVTDIQMPGSVDGIGLSRLVRARHPDMPVIYTTGRPEAMSALVGLGPHDAFVPKPYPPSQIVGIARRLLGYGADAGNGSAGSAGYKQMCA